MVSMQYLIGTQYLLQVIIENRNRHSYVGNPIDDDILQEKLESNDREIFYPLMFNFYHALEIIFKGLIELQTSENLQRKHSLSQLYKRVEKLELNKTDLLLIGSYVSKIDENFPEFAKWMQENKLTIDSFYEFLKYPAATINGKEKISRVELYSDPKLLGKEDKTLPFYKKLCNDIEKIRRLIVKQHHQSIQN